MAAVMQDNLGGQLTILKSQLQELAISFGEILMPAIRAIVTKIQGFIDKLNAMDPATKETIVKIALVAAALGPLLVVVGKTMVGVGKLMQLVSNLPTIIAGAKAAFTSFGAAIGGISAPVVAVIAVVAALVDKDSLRDWIRPDGDPSVIVEKALTNMVFETAVEYHRSPLEFITA